MRINKRIFWWCVFIILASLGLIILCELLNDRYCNDTLFSILTNIAISLLSGAIIGLITAYISYCMLRRQAIVKFYSDYKQQSQIIGKIANWYTFYFKGILYPAIRDDKVDSLNDKNVKKWFSYVQELENYDYDTMYEVLDDYCDLVKTNQYSKVRKQLCNMARSIQSYNIRSSEEYKDYLAYANDMLDEKLLYERVISKQKELFSKRKIETLCEEGQALIHATKINKYLDRIYKNM